MEHLEGRQSVLAALAARSRTFEVILVQHGKHENKIRDVLDAAGAAGVPVKHVAGAELDSIAHGASHGGVLAICSARRPTSISDLLKMVDDAVDPPLILLIEGIEDARNLGFTLRSAEALGAMAVLVKKHLWDFDPVEIARPASGAYERLPLVQLEDVGPLRELQQRGLRLLGCIGGARQDIRDAELTGGVMLAIGGEKRGLSGAVRAICDGMVTIPTRPGASSLPLSHAAAIVLAEASRQRRAVHPPQATQLAAAAAPARIWRVKRRWKSGSLAGSASDRAARGRSPARPNEAALGRDQGGEPRNIERNIPRFDNEEPGPMTRVPARATSTTGCQGAASMSKANVDPSELRRFAADLNRFNNELQGLMGSLHGKLRGLEATWRDQEQRKFTEAFEQTTKAIGVFLENAHTHVQFLNKKATAIEEYLKQR